MHHLTTTSSLTLILIDRSVGRTSFKRELSLIRRTVPGMHRISTSVSNVSVSIALTSASTIATANDTSNVINAISRVHSLPHQNTAGIKHPLRSMIDHVVALSLANVHYGGRKFQRARGSISSQCFIR